MSLNISRIAEIVPTDDENVMQVRVDPAVMYPAAIERMREIVTLVKSVFGGLDQYLAAGSAEQMRFALSHQISAAELPLIPALFGAPESAFDDALLPVWQLPQAQLQSELKRVRDKDEARLFGRAWMLDSALALFMREMKEYSRTNQFGYNTEIGRDLRYSLKWIPDPDSVDAAV